MGFDTGRVEVDFRQFLFEVVFADGAKDTFPNAAGTPSIESFPDAFRLSVPFRQVLPGNSGLQHKQDCIDKQPVVGSGPAGIALLAGQEISNRILLPIRQFVSSGHRLSSLRPPTRE